MNWEDERYVRIYVRDTPTWKMLPWQAKCCLPLIARKLDRAGLMEVGDYGLDGLAALIEMPLEVVAVGMEALLRRGVVQMGNGVVLMPKFLEAQEAKASDKARAAKARELARDLAKAGLESRPETVTFRDETSQGVTKRSENEGTPGGSVTPSRAVPSRTVEAVVAREPLALVPPPPVPEKPKRPKQAKKPEAPTPQEQFYGWAQDKRREVLGEEWKPDSTWPPGKIRRQLESVVAQHADQAGNAYMAFLADERMRTVRNNPPWPMWIFVQEAGRYLTLAEQSVSG